MIAFPNAKINIGLRILNRRPDGYHNLETLFLPITLRDILEIVPRTDEFGRTRDLEKGMQGCEEREDLFFARGLYVDGPPKSNTVLRVVKLLRERGHPIPPLRIELFKAIPSGAGLGGGSADAAFALELLNERFQLKIDQGERSELLCRIGADCPFFLCNTPMIGTETGNHLIPFSLPPEALRFHITIVKPPFGISTAEAYQNASKHPESEGQLATLLAQSPQSWKHTIVNDFEEHLFSLHPQLDALKSLLYQHGAIYAAMSGSGSALFALSSEPIGIESVKKSSIVLRDCFIWEGNLLVPQGK